MYIANCNFYLLIFQRVWTRLFLLSSGSLSPFLATVIHRLPCRWQKRESAKASKRAGCPSGRQTAIVPLPQRKEKVCIAQKSQCPKSNVLKKASKRDGPVHLHCWYLSLYFGANVCVIGLPLSIFVHANDAQTYEEGRKKAGLRVRNWFSNRLFPLRETVDWFLSVFDCGSGNLRFEGCDPDTGLLCLFGLLSPCDGISRSRLKILLPGLEILSVVRRT